MNKRLEVLATEFTVDGRRNRFPAAETRMAGGTFWRHYQTSGGGLWHPLSPLGYDGSEVCEFLVLQITAGAAVPHCLHLMHTECSPEAVGCSGGGTVRGSSKLSSESWARTSVGICLKKICLNRKQTGIRPPAASASPPSIGMVSGLQDRRCSATVRLVLSLLKSTPAGVAS